MAVCSACRTVLRRHIDILQKLRQRRAHSTNNTPTTATKAGQQQHQIPTPNNVPTLNFWQRLGPLTRAAQAYARAQRKRPYVTQVCTSLVIYLCSDRKKSSLRALQKFPNFVHHLPIPAASRSRAIERWLARLSSSRWPDTYLRAQRSLAATFQPFARAQPRLNSHAPRRLASTASSSAKRTPSTARNVFLTTLLATTATVTYYYATDTRASIHQWLVPRLIRVLFPDAEDAHHAGTAALKTLYPLGLHPRERPPFPEDAHPATGTNPLAVTVFGTTLANPIGISAGLDKDAEIADPLFALGAGVVEVGGCTPLPQAGNPRPRVFRVPAVDGLVNRYGLNSRGADAMAARLRERLRKFARGLGLSEREVLEAGEEEGGCADGESVAGEAARLAPYADVLVVNVSSPNTPGLRDLQAAEPLARLLGAVVDEAKRAKRKVKPRVMVKVSPDEDDDTQMDGVVQAVWMSGVDGVIVGNTTKRRTGLVKEGIKLTGREQKALVEDGGFSGPAMFDRTLSLVGRYRKMLDSYSLKTSGVNDVFPTPKVIFATGGITNGDQALQVLNAGASVAMVYTGMVYGGSGTITRIKKEMREKLALKEA
ncbi:hypothetical protein CHGG_04097 [Chaetomium globosum CBS 148.51]|uniref:Dihydroorotate dehydrogenase catalytic domain-containing protein n=1 Tax=Chaetomium globosum (strain ATCC 6205 / CBS 148.51 / DSM 1962 / NBRC 6347 / NRRL 1970) TaxID=306901 RepID=Q2H299_CHAGB|nr:uncharacterized protein CHGG_04097 [Chaetomium globosum CBS 148.51]EAQ87478.1 hypothetical protein CHGG_04097 [Chaetomium globosum CBS 148.51]